MRDHTGEAATPDKEREDLGDRKSFDLLAAANLVISPDKFGKCTIEEWVRESTHDAASNGLLTKEDARRIAAQAVEFAVGRANCTHEPYQGRCIHCNVAFVSGKPDFSALSKARSAGKPECSADHSKYIGKCPYCHTALPGPSKDERDAVIEECKAALTTTFLKEAGSGVSANDLCEALDALKHSPKAGQEDMGEGDLPTKDNYPS